MAKTKTKTKKMQESLRLAKMPFALKQFGARAHAGNCNDRYTFWEERKMQTEARLPVASLRAAARPEFTEILDRVRKLRPEIAGRALASEKAKRVPAETMEALRDAAWRKARSMPSPKRPAVLGEWPGRAFSNKSPNPRSFKVWSDRLRPGSMPSGR
jgi:hypothetical protein